MRTMKSSINRYCRRQMRREFNKAYHSYKKSNHTYTNNVKKEETSTSDVLIGLAVFIGVLIFIGWLF